MRVGPSQVRCRCKEKGELVESRDPRSRDCEPSCIERESPDVKGFELVGAAKHTVEMLMLDDDEKTALLSRASWSRRLYKAILLMRAPMSSAVCARLPACSATPSWLTTAKPDITGVMATSNNSFDESVAAQEYLIPPSEAKALFDLAAVDWKALEEAFGAGQARTAAQRLRSLLSAALRH